MWPRREATARNNEAIANSARLDANTKKNGRVPDYTQCGILHLDAEVPVCI